MLLTIFINKNRLLLLSTSRLGTDVLEHSSCLLLVWGKNSLWPSGAKNRISVMSFEKIFEQRQIIFSVIFSPVFDCRLRAWRQPWNIYLSMLHFLDICDDQNFDLCQRYSWLDQNGFSWRGLVWSASVKFFPFCMIMILAMIDIIKVNDKREEGVVHLFVI